MRMDLVARKIAEDKDLLAIASVGEGYEDEGKAAAAILLAMLAEQHIGAAALFLLMEAIGLAVSLNVPGYGIEKEDDHSWLYQHPAGVFVA